MIDPTETAGARNARLHLGAGLFFGLWSAFGWYAQLGNVQLGDDFGLDPGPGFLPVIVLFILTAGSLALIVLGLAERVKAGAFLVDWRSILRESVAPALLCLSLAAYVPLIRAIGFVPATVVYSGLLMATLVRDELRAAPRPTLISIAIGIFACSALTYSLFIYWIEVPLR